MTGCVDHADQRFAHGNLLPVPKQNLCRAVGMILAEKQSGRIFHRIRQHLCIRLVNGHRDIIFIPQNIRTEDVVEMAVREQNTTDCQFVLRQNLIDSLRR